jgi:Fe-S oxidoreductase
MELAPIGLEGFDSTLTEHMEMKGRLTRQRQELPTGGAWLLVEFGDDDPDEATEKALRASRELKGDGPHLEARVLVEQARQMDVWLVRESAVGDSRVPGVAEFEGAWEDASVHPEKLGAYLREFAQLLEDHGYRCVYYGHFGQGCVHTRIDFDFKTAAGLRTFRSFMERAADLVVSYGGSLAGEYGEGHGHAELLPKMFGPELMGAFHEFKRIWDPDSKMNPNRLIGDVKLDEGLRFGPDYQPPQLDTHFAYPDDGGSFAAAAERCFGMAKCRNLGSLTMCPSFQATREERLTTRGRARLLQEMLQGDPLTGAWREEAVKESLELCLSCKGCTGECPVQVDMPTYKAEFFSHYYAGRRRPLKHYVLGVMPWWGRAASRVPRLSNALANGPMVGRLGKRLLGLAEERDAPAFARETFAAWFGRRGLGSRGQDSGRRRVVLWPDTFTNFFSPEIGMAAVEVLEAAGFAPELPSRPVCCGRPLYDYGLLGPAKRTLSRTLGVLGEVIGAGVPVLVLEPSCAAVFRDELGKLMPRDERARSLAQQTVTLDELLAREAADWVAPRLGGRALMHGHCHHHAVIGVGGEQRLLEQLGLEVELLRSGCCGLAGSFGYEAGEHYRISMSAAERSLLPAVRGAEEDTLVVADGFSCRTQIKHGANRRALHTAEVLREALRAGSVRADG